MPYIKNMSGIFAGLVAILLTSTATAQVTVDPKLPEYKPAAGVSGSIKSVGSDTMNNMMTLWTEGFKRFYPNVRTEIEDKGSAAAMPALAAGAAAFGPMSRPPKPDEIDQFEKRFGYKPVQISTSIDMLAVYVNKDNPLKALTLAQVDAIFSSTRKRGHANDIRTWGQAGLTGDWPNAPIRLYSRNAASGTYAFFKDVALAKGDFKSTVIQQPGSSGVVQAVASDKRAIGYSGIGYKTADVRAVPLAAETGDDLIAPTVEHAYDDTYPLARPLLLVVNHKPQTALDPLRREFVRYVLSRQGQADVVKDGYFPISAEMAKNQLKLLGIE